LFVHRSLAELGEILKIKKIVICFFPTNSFVGSHLVDRLMLQGHEVIVADNFFTGRKRNIEHWIGHENFELINHDIVHPLYIEGKKKTKKKISTRFSFS
jgi:nucleoside-diphosphate-sugar epimerase